jgi:hypothetical protein
MSIVWLSYNGVQIEEKLELYTIQSRSKYPIEIAIIDAFVRVSER